MLSQIIEANPKLQPHDQAHSKYYFNSTTKKFKYKRKSEKLAIHTSIESLLFS